MGTTLALAAALTAWATVLVPVPPAHADATAPPVDEVVVDVVGVNGTGCPAGSTAVAVPQEPATFGLYFGAYTALVGVGAAATDFRKSCQISLAVHAPAGYTYGVADATHAGYASLRAGASGSLRTTYYVQGGVATAAFVHRFTGPMEDAWTVADIPDYTQILYAPCGVQRNLNITMVAQVSAGTSDPATTTSFLSIGSDEAGAASSFHIALVACPPG